MMKKIYLEVYRKNIKVYESKKRYTFDDNFKANIMSENHLINKRINLVLLGERIWTQEIGVKNISHKKVKEIIKNEVEVKFNYSEDVVYDYIKMKDKVLVYYLNGVVLNSMKNILYKNNVASIKPIQMYIFEHIDRIAKEENYRIISRYEDIVYCISVKNGIIYHDEMLEVKKESEEDIIRECLLNYNKSEVLDTIYFQGINFSIANEFNNIRAVEV